MSFGMQRIKEPLLQLRKRRRSSTSPQPKKKKGSSFWSLSHKHHSNTSAEQHSSNSSPEASKSVSVPAHESSPFTPQTSHHHPNYGDIGPNGSFYNSHVDGTNMLVRQTACRSCISRNHPIQQEVDYNIHQVNSLGNYGVASPTAIPNNPATDHYSRVSSASSFNVIGHNSTPREPRYEQNFPDNRRSTSHNSSSSQYSRSDEMLRGINDRPAACHSSVEALSDEIEAQARASNISSEPRHHKRIARRSNQIAQLEKAVEGVGEMDSTSPVATHHQRLHGFVPPRTRESSGEMPGNGNDDGDGNDGNDDNDDDDDDDDPGDDGSPSDANAERQKVLCPWDGCDRYFKRYRLREHVRRSHFRCLYCDYCDFHQGDLHQVKRHRKTKHPDELDGHHEMAEDELTWHKFQALKVRSLDLKRICGAQSVGEVLALPGYTSAAPWPGLGGEQPNANQSQPMESALYDGDGDDNSDGNGECDNGDGDDAGDYCDDHTPPVLRETDKSAEVLKKNFLRWLNPGHSSTNTSHEQKAEFIINMLLGDTTPEDRIRMLTSEFRNDIYDDDADEAVESPGTIGSNEIPGHGDLNNNHPSVPPNATPSIIPAPAPTYPFNKCEVQAPSQPTSMITQHIDPRDLGSWNDTQWDQPIHPSTGSAVPSAPSLTTGYSTISDASPITRQGANQETPDFVKPTLPMPGGFPVELSHQPYVPPFAPIQVNDGGIDDPTYGTEDAEAIFNSCIDLDQLQPPSEAEQLEINHMTVASHGRGFMNPGYLGYRWG